MRIGARVEGGEAHERAMRALLARLDRGTRQATREAAEDFQGRVQEYLLTYPHTVPPRTTPSPPFVGPPGYVTGRLHDSIHVSGPRPGGRYQWVATVGSNVVYSRIQELGGFSGRHHTTYTPPRPYLQPMIALATVNGSIRERFRTEWGLVLR